MRYRTDRIETTPQGQRVGYADWIGGPTVSRVHAVCPDGVSRWAHVTGEPDTWFSLPAYVNNGAAGRVTGYLTTEDGLWLFRAHTAQEPIQWRPVRPAAKAPEPLATWHVETTDTFGGQANYSWVNRSDFTAPAGASRLAVIRRGKAAAGLTGARCRVTDLGDLIELRPYGVCAVTFITPSY